MVLAYHFILSAYGFWLPNDPRGSWSDFVGAWELLRFGGQATKVDTTRSVAHVSHDRAHRLEMKQHLKYPDVHFTGVQAQAIGAGFAKAANEGAYTILACAILPEHAHLIVTRHDRHVGRISGHLKARATQELRARGLWNHPDDYSPWGRKYWSVFVDEKQWVEKAIAYVENNPAKEGKPKQTWSFITPYNA